MNDSVEKERRTRKRERNILRKHISEMTPADKASFLEATKRALLIEQGVPWEVIEPKIQADINATFDDAQFVNILGSDPFEGMLIIDYENVACAIGA